MQLMINKQTQNVLILAHPGHELRIHHWLEINKPRVYLLTDGSGGKEQSRTHYSEQIIQQTGSARGSVFGDISDKVWYKALTDSDFGFIRSILEAIEADLPDAESYQIVADAVDGYNPVHDLASAMGVALQRRLEVRGKLAKLYFSAAVPSARGKTVLDLVLDHAAKGRKLKALAHYTPLAEEARRILEQDETAINREYIIQQDTDWSDLAIPQWEEIGSQRVAAGTYQSCLTAKDHFQPAVLDLLDAKTTN
jgi:hypothetical protein